MNRYVLIVAGGSGVRMGSDIPKQFLELAGKPVLMHTIERFESFDNTLRIIVVLPKQQLNLWESLVIRYSFTIPHEIAIGGPTRFESVRNGLNLIGGEGLVAIHDGVRPLVSHATIASCFAEAAKSGNAVPVVKATDSLRMLTPAGNMPVNRDLIMLIQTPQVFDVSLITRAYRQEYSPDFTDDATILEKTGVKIRLVEGNRQNIKITNPDDILVAETLLRSVS